MKAVEHTVKCSRCGYEASFLTRDGTTAISAESAARVARWRIWTGATVGGQDGSQTLCPACAGTATPEQEQEIHGWDAHCSTCDARMSDEYEDEGPFTQKDASRWQAMHDCEPYVYLIRPKALAGAA